MSDPQAPAAPPAAPPAAEPAPAAQAAPAAPSPEAAKPARVNPYAGARKPAAPAPTPAAPANAAPAAPAAPAAEAKPKNSRVLALRDAEIAKLKPIVAEHGEAMALLAPVVKAKLEALPEKARKALESSFKDKPLALLKEIQRLDEMGLLATQAPAPATTAPPPGPPTGGVEATDSDMEALQKWQEYQKKSPSLAASFLGEHRAAIKRAQAKQARN